MILTAVKQVCQSGWIVHGECNGCGKSFADINNDASFSLKRAPSPHILVDMDNIGCLKKSMAQKKGKRKCDYLFFADAPKGKPDWVAPIEMSTEKGKKPTEIMNQLQAGADLVNQRNVTGQQYILVPIYVGNVRNPKVFDKKRIKINGRSYGIKNIAVGASIAPCF